MPPAAKQISCGARLVIGWGWRAHHKHDHRVCCRSGRRIPAGRHGWACDYPLKGIKRTLRDCQPQLRKGDAICQQDIGKDEGHLFTIA